MYLYFGLMSDQDLASTCSVKMQKYSRSKKKSVLFTALLNRGAGDNSCYHPANCQQRVITLLSSAKSQERDDNSLL